MVFSGVVNGKDIGLQYVISSHFQSALSRQIAAIYCLYVRGVGLQMRVKQNGTGLFYVFVIRRCQGEWIVFAGGCSI